MGRRHVVRGAWLAIAVIAMVVGPADAQPKPGSSRAGKRLDGIKVQRRGSVKALRGHRIKVAGKLRSVGEVADELFAEQDAVSRELAGARGALLAAPAEESEVIETDHFTVMVKATRAVVVDPIELGRRAPRLDQIRGRKVSQAPTMKDLTPAALRAYRAWKAELAKQPADHPLRVAAAKGDDELLRAVAEGKGELEIVTEVVLPKEPLAVENGELAIPRARAGAGFDHGKRTRRKLGFSTGGENRSARPEREPKPVVSTRGESTMRARFLTGVTKGDSFEWSRTWKFPSGYFEVHASAYYGVGLRAPVRVVGTMSPRVVRVAGGTDRSKLMRVELTATTLDGDAGFYRDTGLAESKIFEGKELVFEAGFDVGYELNAGWGVIKTSGSVGKAFDYGRDFVPPMANCGTRCGLDVWIPADITRTKLGITLGKKTYIKGSARVGFNVGGGGEVEVGYESLFGNDKPRSSYRGKTRTSHRLSFANSSTHRVKTELPAIDRPGSRNYGFRLYDPSYTWKVKITPGVRVDIDVRAGNWIDKRYTVGPLWLNGLALDLGALELPHHDGTVKAYRLKNGEKTFVSE